MGQLNWLSTVFYPELRFEVCQASSKIKDVTVAEITSMNKVIFKVKKEQACIHFPTLDLSSVHLRVSSDASFNSLLDGGSQEVYIVLLADHVGKCSPISWSSNHIRQAVRSTLAAETLALNDGCDSAFSGFLSVLLITVVSPPTKSKNCPRPLLIMAKIF